MYVLNTTDTEEWLDAVSSRHQLPLDIVSYNKKDFFSQVNAALFSDLPDISFAHVSTSGYHGLYDPEWLKGRNEVLLITHSFGRWSGLNNKRCLKVNDQSFAIDLSSKFEGYFHGVGTTKSIMLPFDKLNPHTVDFLRQRTLSEHPNYAAITRILKNMNVSEKIDNLSSKIKAVMQLLSQLEPDSEHDLHEYFKNVLSHRGRK